MDEALKKMEEFRISIIGKEEPADYVIRVCEAILASYAGYKNRADWQNKARGLVK